MIRFYLQELEYRAREGRLTHSFICQQRQETLNDFIVNCPIVEGRGKRPDNILYVFLVFAAQSVSQPLELLVEAELIRHSITILAGCISPQATTTLSLSTIRYTVPPPGETRMAHGSEGGLLRTWEELAHAWHS